MRLPAIAASLFPARAAPADEAALDQHLDEVTRFYGRGCALALNLLHCVFWPTDRYLLPPDPAVHHVMHWFRVSTFTVHAIYLAALLVPSVRRHPLPVLAATVACSSALFGVAMAHLGGLEQPYFYLTYLAPMGISAIPARTLRRVVLSPTCAAVLCASYFLARPAALASPYCSSAVGCMVFVVVVSQIIGHGMFLLTRRAFLTSRALDRSRSMLKEYSEHLEDKVADHALQLRRLAAYREQAAGDERARLARELHDEVGQQLTALGYSLTAARAAATDEPTRARLGALLADVVHLAESVRGLVSDLRPRVLEDRGLGPALQWLLERAGAQTGLPCTLTPQVDPDVRVPRAHAMAVFRIVQESLTNALRHARPSAVRVTLHVSAAAVEASVHDDGCGMGPVDMTCAGMGLFGMSERATALGGRLEVCSEPGAGTEVRVRLPLPGATG